MGSYTDEQPAPYLAGLRGPVDPGLAFRPPPCREALNLGVSEQFKLYSSSWMVSSKENPWPSVRRHSLTLIQQLAPRMEGEGKLAMCAVNADAPCDRPSKTSAP